MVAVTALARIPVRRLDQVLTEIKSAQIAFDAVWRLDQPDLRHEIARLDRLNALQDEARAMIEAATGVSWEAISGASL